MRTILLVLVALVTFALGACAEKPNPHLSVDSDVEVHDDMVDGVTDDANNQFQGFTAYCGMFPAADLADAGVTCEPCSQDTECVNDAVGVEYTCDGAMSPATCRDPEEMEDLDPCEDYYILNGEWPSCAYYNPRFEEGPTDSDRHFELGIFVYPLSQVCAVEDGEGQLLVDSLQGWVSQESFFFNSEGTLFEWTSPHRSEKMRCER